MDCEDVLDRLVALEEGELGPSEEELVRRHLAGCPTCATVSSRLGQSLPRPGLAVPLVVRNRLARLEASTLLAAADPLPSGRRARPATVSLPVPAAVGYAAVLVVVLAWGMANWRERAVLEARLALGPPQAAAAPEIPASDYRPAAWTPNPTPESP